MKNKLFLKRFAAAFLSTIFIMGIFSSCKFESVAEHESRLAGADSTVLMEELQDSVSESGEISVPATGDIAAGQTETHAESGSDTLSGTTQGRTQVPGQNSGQNNSPGDSAAGTTAPGEKNTSAGEQPESIVVAVSVNCANAVGNSKLNEGIKLPADGVILARSSVTVENNTNVFEILKSVCEQKKITMLYQDSMYGKYVQKIGPIGEKECGAQSGWTYRVNGLTPQASADKFGFGKKYKKLQLKNGDSIEWVYVTHA